MLGYVEHIDETRRFGVHVEQAGQHFAFFVGLVQAADRLDPIGGIVIFFKLAEAQSRSVMHGDFDRSAGIVLHVNFLECRDEADVLQRLLVVFHVFVGFRRTLVIVEGHARRNHVEHDRSLVGDGRFQQTVQLPLVAGERTADQSRAQRDGHGAGIDGRKIVDHAGLQLRSEVGGCGELAFGQAVHAIVLDDVNDGQVAAHEVDELPDADGGGVAVAADAEGNQLMVGQQGSGCDRGHAAVHGVEAVGAAHEICRALRGAADAAGLDHALGLHAHFVHGVDDALGNRIVAAAGAKRGLATAVVENGQANAIDFGCGCGCAGRGRHLTFPPCS